MLQLLLVSLVAGTELPFHYQTDYRRSDDSCKLCYGEDCFPVDQARCEYYMEADAILHEPEGPEGDNPVLREEVDLLVNRFMEKATATDTECVPLVSQYTDCTKANICIGCKSCNCDAAGRWNCTQVNKCRPDFTMTIDHRMLVFVMENLMNAETTRRTKRDIQESPENTRKLSFDEISRWMFEDTPFKIAEETPKNIINSTISLNETTATVVSDATTSSNINTETTTPDYLGFDEVLNNIAVDAQAYTRRKPLDIVHNDSIAFDYMIFDEENATEAVTYRPEYDNFDNQFAPSNTEGETDIVIDLLESAKKNQGESFTANWTDYTEADKTNVIDPALDYIDNFILGSKNVMKRDILSDQKTEVITQKANITNNVNELRNNVLLPLSNIINDKQKELEELLRVSENLIKIMRSYNQSMQENMIANNEYPNSSISIYNFEIPPELVNEHRRSDSSLLHKYVMKLKRDIYEVIRDIAGIQKQKGTASIPQDLKTLLHAMKRYVRSQAILGNKENKLESDVTKSRRLLDNTNNYLTKKSLVSEIINILKIIDQYKPENNALAALSPSTRKIIHRIIKNNYINEFSVIGLRIFDPEYNLTKDLRKIGSDWPRMTDIVGLSKINDKLYAMKLLHLVLSLDILKMQDALALLDFAYNRRMILVEGGLAGEIVERINKGLKAINEKIKVIIKLHNKKEIKKIDNEKPLNVTKVKKESFLKKLKNILKSSKKDIVDMLKKKVSKKDIIKDLAKKKMNEITRRRFLEFEDTMRKWQNNLNIVPRDKRSARDDNYKNRMKSILPKYLRGKVKPAIAAKKAKKRTQRKLKKHSKTTTTVLPKVTSKLNTSLVQIP